MCEGGYGEGVRNVFGIGEKQIIRVSNNRVFNMKFPLFRWIPRPYPKMRTTNPLPCF